MVIDELHVYGFSPHVLWLDHVGFLPAKNMHGQFHSGSIHVIPCMDYADCMPGICIAYKQIYYPR